MVIKSDPNNSKQNNPHYLYAQDNVDYYLLSFNFHIMAPNKKKEIHIADIKKELAEGHIAPLYFLEGEEPYYIDLASKLIIDAVLPNKEDRELSLLSFFGAESRVEDIISYAMGFPMGGEKQIILIKEAQQLKNIEKIEFYLRNPQRSSVIIICYKNGKLDRRKKIFNLIANNAVLFTSNKLRDYELPSFIKNYVKTQRMAIDNDAATLIAECVGTDLSRIVEELKKICINRPSSKNITKEIVAENIGISKEFNIFELQEALINKNYRKSELIVRYFQANTKTNPIQKVLPTLFSFFKNLMIAFYAPEKSPRGIASFIGIQEWQVNRNILPAMNHYSGTKVMKIIGKIRNLDREIKGNANRLNSTGKELEELIFFILH